MKKYKLIIAPSSNDESEFEQAAIYSEALHVINTKDIESAQEYSFNTKEERDIFLQGYHAAIGYNGDGLFWTTEEGSDEQEQENTEQETPIETPWDFVEKYYPNYTGCNTIGYADDLQKFLDEELKTN